MTNAPTPAGMAEAALGRLTALLTATHLTGDAPVPGLGAVSWNDLRLLAAQPSAGAEGEARFQCSTCHRAANPAHFCDRHEGGPWCDECWKVGDCTEVHGEGCHTLFVEAAAHPAPVLTAAENVIERLRNIHRRNPTEYDECCSIIDAIRATPVQPDGGGVVEALREALEGFVMDLTGTLENRDTMLTINHNGLSKRIKQALAALAPVAAEGGEEDKLRAALAWYGEQARLARLIHSEGDIGRVALADDGGKRAQVALRTESTGGGEGA